MSALVCLIPVVAAAIVAVDDPIGSLVCFAYFGLLFTVVAVVFHRKL